jgi:putative flippase GtrA
VNDPQREERMALIGQIIRFGISGGLLTLLIAGGYWAVADLLHVDPNLSLLMVFIIVSGFGYLLHSRWSFKGHGARDNPHVRTIKFLTTNTLGFLSNQFFVWLLVKHAGGPTWWAIPPIVLVTPILTFTLNRKWVFG